MAGDRLECADAETGDEVDAGALENALPERLVGRETEPVLRCHDRDNAPVSAELEQPHQEAGREVHPALRKATLQIPTQYLTLLPHSEVRHVRRDEGVVAREEIGGPRRAGDR